MCFLMMLIVTVTAVAVTSINGENSETTINPQPEEEDGNQYKIEKHKNKVPNTSCEINSYSFQVLTIFIAYTYIKIEF